MILTAKCRFCQKVFTIPLSTGWIWPGSNCCCIAKNWYDCSYRIGGIWFQPPSTANSYSAASWKNVESYMMRLWDDILSGREVLRDDDYK